jgi:signal transduction histidine kinase
MAWLRTRSLTGRLLLLLLMVQAGVPVLGMAAWMLFSPYVTWTDVAAASAERLVAASLVRDGGGRAHLVPGPALMAYAAQRPGFAYAVFQDGLAIEGSDPALAMVLAPLGPVLPEQGQIAVQLPGGRAIAQFDAGSGAEAGLTFVTVGNAFHANDIGGFLRTYLPALVPIFGPSLLVAAFAVPLVVHRTMRPLHEAARQAERIAFTALTPRLAEQAVPAEALPLVRAVNAALDRLAEGAERQRLFHANAAHELRTPVAILQARLDAMPELARGHEVRRDVTRIALLVEQLLAVERLGACGPGTDEVDLVPRVQALVADCAPLAIRSGRTLAFLADAESVCVRGNRRAIDSAIANLIDNALRAEPEGGCVQVRVCQQAEVSRAQVMVIDHGEGVSPADRTLVFEPFWRKDERPPGSGLGLSIVRAVARLHQGDVQVTDTQGGGATFLFYLPASPASPAAAHAGTVSLPVSA